MHGFGDILFGTSRARWRVGASGPQYVAMKRILSVSIAAVALPLLVACSGGGSPASTTPGSPATAAPATSDAAAPGSTDAPIVAGDDEFCALAVEAQGVADEVTVLTADMNTTIVEALGTGDIATINTWGSELAALSQEMVDFYSNGRPYIEGQEVEGAWNLMEQFTRDYSLAVANEAATATDTADFTAKMGAIVSDPGIQAAVNFGPAAAQSVGAYITTRCGA